MKTDKRIILYFDGQLSGEERKNFEQELKHSPQLASEFKNYKKTISEISELKDIAINESYFNEILPRFRNGEERKRKFTIQPKIAFAVTIVIAFLTMFLLKLDFAPAPQFTGIENLKNQLTAEEVAMLLDINISDFYADSLFAPYVPAYDSVLNSMLYEDMDVNEKTLNKIVDNDPTQFYRFADNISDDDADIIYNELINKKF